MGSRTTAAPTGGLLLLVGWLAATPLAAAGVELEARLWALDVDGGLAILTPQLSFGLAEDLAFDPDDSVEGRVTFRPGLGLFLRLAYQTLSMEGRADTFAIVPLPQLEEGRLESSLEYDYGRVALGWQYVAPGKVVRIGPFVEAKGVQGDASLALTGLGQSIAAAESFETGFSSAGALVEIQPGRRLQIFAEASFALDRERVDVTDWEAGVRLRAAGPLGVGLGYRSLEIEGESDGVSLRLEQTGAFLSAVLRF